MKMFILVYQIDDEEFVDYVNENEVDSSMNFYGKENLVYLEEE